MGLECFLGLGCLRTIGWLVVELFCFLGGGGGVGGRISGVQKIFGALQSASGGGKRIGCWVGEGFVAPVKVFDWIG